MFYGPDKGAIVRTARSGGEPCQNAGIDNAIRHQTDHQGGCEPGDVVR